MDEVLTLAETAKLLKVSTRTVERMVADGRLSPTRIGHQWRFLRSNIMGLFRPDDAPVASAVPARLEGAGAEER